MMLFVSYGSVCELEMQILLTGNLDLIKKGELGTLTKDIAEKTNPGILGPSSPTKLEKSLNNKIYHYGNEYHV